MEHRDGHSSALRETQSLQWLLLQGTPLMVVSTALVAAVMGPVFACAVAALGLLRILLLHHEQQHRQVPTGGESTTGSAGHAGWVVTQAEQEEVQDQEVLLPISGIWRKDNKLSEPMDDMMNLVRLNPIIRRAVFLVNGLELHATNNEFKMSVLCAIPWFKVRRRRGIAVPAHHSNSFNLSCLFLLLCPTYYGG